MLRLFLSAFIRLSLKNSLKNSTHNNPRTTPQNSFYGTFIVTFLPKCKFKLKIVVYRNREISALLGPTAAFWSHFGTRSSPSTPPVANDDISQKNSMQSQRTEEDDESGSQVSTTGAGGGPIGNSVSFVDGPPKLHNYSRETETTTAFSIG